MKIKIKNANIVTPDKVLENSDLIIDDDHILDFGYLNSDFGYDEIIDAKNKYVIPGLIDLHSDAVEFKLTPRPNVSLPEKFVFSFYEKELLNCGITTIYHGMYWGDMIEKHRNLELTKDLINKILNYKESGVINHKILIRFDIYNYEGSEELKELINKGKVDLLAFQYHLPGTAQFKDIDAFINYYTKVRGWKKEEIEEFIKTKKIETYFIFKDEKRNKILKEIAQLAKEKDISISSHDDDSIEKIDYITDMGANISEFPVNFETAKYAKEKNMDVIVGAPNIVRGKSSCGNLSAKELVKEKIADIICSDYNPQSMIYAMIILYLENILPLNEAVNLVTKNPAKAAKLKNLGSIEKGNFADIVIFSLNQNNIPEVKEVFVKGKRVYSYHGK